MQFSLWVSPQDAFALAKDHLPLDHEIIAYSRPDHSQLLQIVISPEEYEVSLVSADNLELSYSIRRKPNP